MCPGASHANPPTDSVTPCWMIGLGLLITKVLNDVWPFTVEDGCSSWNTFVGGGPTAF